MSAKSSSVNEHLKTINEVFHVKIYTKLEAIKWRITYLLYYIYLLYTYSILQRDNYVVKSAKILTILGRFVQKM